MSAQYSLHGTGVIVLQYCGNLMAILEYLLYGTDRYGVVDTFLSLSPILSYYITTKRGNTVKGKGIVCS